MQEEVQRNEIDKYIYRLRKLNPSISWKDIAEEIQQRFHLTCSINDLINRYEALTAKLPEEKISILFQQFQRWQTNFQKISERTSIGIDSVKRQILSVLVNNIIKVCFIVRKRGISFLKSNFLSNIKIQQLVVLMLNENNFVNVKKEYSIFWNFVRQYYPINHFVTISSEQYKSVYRELIILAEAFNINNGKEEHLNITLSDSFERKIIESTGTENDKIKQMLELSRNRKKNQKQMINLVSDEQESRNEENLLLGVEMREENEDKIIEGENKREMKNNILRKAILLYSQLTKIEKQIKMDPENVQLKNRQKEIGLDLSCLKFLQMKIENE